MCSLMFYSFCMRSKPLLLPLKSLNLCILVSVNSISRKKTSSTRENPFKSEHFQNVLAIHSACYHQFTWQRICIKRSLTFKMFVEIKMFTSELVPICFVFILLWNSLQCIIMCVHFSFPLPLRNRARNVKNLQLSCN